MPVVRDFTALPAYNWNFVANEAQPVGRPTLLTYSFPDAANPGLMNWVGEAAAKTFSPFTEAERTIVRSTLEKMAAISGLTLVEVSGNNGDIKIGCVDFTLLSPEYRSFNGISNIDSSAPFWRADDGNVYPNSEEYWQNHGRYPDQFGDIVVNLNYRSYPFPTDWLIEIVLHEFGHSLGLKHPFEAGVYNINTLAPDLDKWSNTVMSYTYDKSTNALGPLDIQALKYIYGSNDLDGKQFSSWSFDRPTETFRLNFSNAADQIRGTGSRDIIDAGDGDDVVFASAGNDIIIGGGGIDRVSGGLGIDTFVVGYAKEGTKVSINAYGQMFLDRSGKIEFAWDIERVQFTDKLIAYDLAGNAGQAYRLYQAAFDRKPDIDGLSYWIKQLDNGLSLKDVAQGFVGSAEALSVYGASSSNSDFVARLYQNVLGRPGEAGGVAHWNSVLDRGIDRATVLAGFSESPENIRLVGPSIQDGIWISSL